jgi:glutaconate CoA-transferase subunit B
MASQLTSLFFVMCLGQTGFVTTGFLGGGQVDRYGNVNDTVVGDYYKPIHRWPGSGGGNDVMSFSRRTIVTLRQTKRRFPERVDFITCPGYLDGNPGRREEMGLLPGTGPSAVITDLGVYGFEGGEMVLKSIHGGVGVTLEQVKAEVGWDIKVSPELEETSPPTREELRMLREKVDPEGRWVEGRRASR